MNIMIEFISKFGIFIDVICIIVTLTGITGMIIRQKRRKTSVIINKFLIIIIVIAVAMLFMSKFYVPNLVKIPEIKNVRLDTAKTILSERELSYKLVNEDDYKDIDERLYIVSLDNDSEGTYVYKGEVIKLKIMDTEKNIEKAEIDETLDWDKLDAYSPDEVEISSDVKRIDLNIGLEKIIIKQLLGNGTYTRALTEKIGEMPKKLYLYDIENKILYKQYELGNSDENERIYIFKNLPYGDYMLLVEVDGYVKFSKEVIINGDNVINGYENLNVILQEKETEKEVWFVIEVMDENHNAIKDAECLIYNDADGKRYGYLTDEKGNFTGSGFAAKNGAEFNVDIEVNGKSYGSARIKTSEDTTIILILKRDGTIEVTNSTEVYN